MTELRVVRTLAVPLAIVLVFLVFTPRLCQRAVVQGTARQPISVTSGEPARGGLILSSSTPPPGQSRDLRFPPGLDASRIQYLIEIDSTFAAPFVMPAIDGSPVANVLLEKQYVEKRPDGMLGPTREGLMNVSGATDSPHGWMVPVAQRKFVSLDAIDDVGEGRYTASVRWRWAPNAIGDPLLKRREDHQLIAEFAGGEHHWVLMRYVKEPDRELR